jgi:hypothetical protein
MSRHFLVGQVHIHVFLCPDMCFVWLVSRAVKAERSEFISSLDRPTSQPQQGSPDEGRHRKARACAVLGRRLQLSSSNRCSAVTITTDTGRPLPIDTLYCIRCKSHPIYGTYFRLGTLATFSLCANKNCSRPLEMSGTSAVHGRCRCPAGRGREAGIDKVGELPF